MKVMRRLWHWNAFDGFASRFNMTFEEALEAAKASNVFTVHTPVAAGNDEFPVEMMDKYFGDYYGKLGLNREQFLALGRVHPDR